jgi:hypothetical protein
MSYYSDPYSIQKCQSVWTPLGLKGNSTWSFRQRSETAEERDFVPRRPMWFLVHPGFKGNEGNSSASDLRVYYAVDERCTAPFNGCGYLLRHSVCPSSSSFPIWLSRSAYLSRSPIIFDCCGHTQWPADHLTPEPLYNLRRGNYFHAV